MSRAASGTGWQAPRTVDVPPGAVRNAPVVNAVVRVLGAGGEPRHVVQENDEATMNAKTETAAHGIEWAERKAPERRSKTPIGVLGFVALGLWVMAVLLGIGAPLVGLEVDARLVVGVLLASGIVSLLSLPLTACTADRAGKPVDRKGPEA
jgi:hypothetical protein